MTKFVGAVLSLLAVGLSPRLAWGIDPVWNYAVQLSAIVGYSGYGYLQSAINLPLVDNRGKVVLIVENTYAANLSTELTRLQQDLAGDGWTVLRHDVGRNDSVGSVKNLIKADYTFCAGFSRPKTTAWRR